MPVPTYLRKISDRRRIMIAVIIFFVALGVRLLSWHDTRLEVWKVQTVVAQDYRRIAGHFLQGGLSSFFSSSSPLSDPNTLGHPPGYSMVMALVFRLFGESDTAIQLVKITADALAAVVIFLIAAELLSLTVATIAGLLVAFSPQFAWNSVLLLPDSLAVLPLLLAVYFLARGSKQPRVVNFLLAGVCVGLSCWLRANTLLLAPFLACVLLLLFARGKRGGYALALLGGAILVIAPLTIRNAIVFRHFIPVSLGAGQTFLEGLADYDPNGKFGVPATDMGLLKQEAELYKRPDYYSTLFNPDGIKRERMRLARGFAVVRAHPIWFSGVMARRGASMFRLERARLISAQPPVSHPLTVADQARPVWTNTPADLLANSQLGPQAGATLTPDNRFLLLTGDDSNYGRQFASAPFTIQENTDYLLTLPLKLERGRIRLSVESGERNATLASTVAETLEATTPEAQPERKIEIPFLSIRSEAVRLVINNEASNSVRAVARLDVLQLYSMGPASYLWTRYPRFIVRNIQKLFLTAVVLPLVLFGIALLVRERRGKTLLLLLAVPAYYVCFQSALHTEYRYVLAIHYFLFAIAAVALSWIGNASGQALRRLFQFSSRRTD